MKGLKTEWTIKKFFRILQDFRYSLPLNNKLFAISEEDQYPRLPWEIDTKWGSSMRVQLYPKHYSSVIVFQDKVFNGIYSVMTDSDLPSKFQ